ncbi:hypothetical protein GUJ93_ZPchr0013g34758 [Zizania palustris]|uniref:Uncharacterized protein n=1 Tax=Zizania palustris TaxID=103762 RepID=A0A8J5X5X8_ZIZPA|nr:hypothetical protein GUJ93_ZPchr0013g34758 [Zizania palustris]
MAESLPNSPFCGMIWEETIQLHCAKGKTAKTGFAVILSLPHLPFLPKLQSVPFATRPRLLAAELHGTPYPGHCASPPCRCTASSAPEHSQHAFSAPEHQLLAGSRSKCARNQKQQEERNKKSARNGEEEREAAEGNGLYLDMFSLLRPKAWTHGT